MVDSARIGAKWGAVQQQALYTLIQEAGKTGAKRSIPRIAKAAGVSPQFIRSLLPTPKQHETSKVEAVLAALDVTPSEFAALVRKEA